ncbi:MAG TPA: DUF1285 domain-containing protein [Proteobacteria bacterium]|nr:DUF1285 domain-containing protein [Pseudomonadota bacterium]
MEQTEDYILIDGQGQWWYEGNQIIHPEVLALFKSSLIVDPAGGNYFIDYKGKRAPVRVEKTPFFIHDIEVKRNGEGDPLEIILVLDDGTREILVPSTLALDDSGALRARVKNDRFAARCLPTAHFRLAELLREDEGVFFLVLAGHKYRLESRT